MNNRPTKFGAEDLRQLAWRNSYLKSKEQEIHSNPPIPRVSKFGVKRDSLAVKTTLPPLVEDAIPSVARNGVYNNEPRNPWYKRRTSVPSSITSTYKNQQRNSIEYNNYTSQPFGPGGSPKMLPISTNMMSGCINQAQSRRTSLPATLTSFNHGCGIDLTKIPPPVDRHESQKDGALFKRRKSTQNRFTQ